MSVDNEFDNPGSKHYGLDPERGYKEIEGQAPTKWARYQMSNGTIREYQVFVNSAEGSFKVRSVDLDDKGQIIDASSFPVGVFDTEEELLIFKQNFDHGHKLLESTGF